MVFGYLNQHGPLISIVRNAGNLRKLKRVGISNAFAPHILASPSSGSLQSTLTHLARFTFTEVCHVEEASQGGCPFGSVFGHFAL
jgi:hypothetical protein